MSEHKLEALKIGYENQVNYLKLMTEIDMKLFFGSLTLQLVFANWIAVNPVETITLKIAFIFMELSIVGISSLLFVLNHYRRRAVTDALTKFSHELGFLSGSNFGIEVELIEKPNLKSWYWIYILSNSIMAIGVCVTIVFAKNA